MNACIATSWKKQTDKHSRGYMYLERAVRKDEKLETFKLETFQWKVRNQIRKNEVGKFACTLSNYQAVHLRLNFTFEFNHAAGSGDYVEKNEIKILELSIRPLILE